MDIQMYRAKVKTEGVENFERGTGMKLNLVMNGNKKENKNKEAEEGRKGGREKGAGKFNRLLCMEWRFIRSNVSEM